jgi:hypothetical protein
MESGEHYNSALLGATLGDGGNRKLPTARNGCTRDPISEGLKQLDGCDGSTDVYVRKHNDTSSVSSRGASSNDDRKRRNKEAKNRIYQKKCEHPVVRENVPATPTPAEMMTAKVASDEIKARPEKPKRIIDPLTDPKRVKIFMSVESWKLSGGGNWFIRWLRSNRVLNFSLLALAGVTCMIGFAVSIQSLSFVTLAEIYAGLGIVGFCVITLLVVLRYIRHERVSIAEWDRGHDAGHIHALSSIIETEEINMDEVNGMSGLGFNSFRFGVISSSALGWLSMSKTPQPTNFTIQQFSDLLLKEFDGLVSRSVLLNTATFHHQTLLADFRLMKMATGTVKDFTERY